MKTKSTKSLLLGLSLIVATATVNAQAPFGTPPGGNLQPPTPDKVVPNVPTDYVGGLSGTYSGGTAIPPCVFDDIQRTGNDIKEIRLSGDVAEAMVWDGSCPSFSFIVSGNAATQSPLQSAFIVNLEANNHGFVSDPDIIISHNDVIFGGSTIGILIVYEFRFSGGGVRHVAYEQWNYDYSTNTIYFVTTGPQPNIISSGVDSDNPNIDGNNENEIAIVYNDGMFNVSSYVDLFTSPTSINTANRILLNACGFNGEQPDVAIADHTIAPNVSYIYVDNSNLILHQENFTSLYNTLTPACTSVSVIGTDYSNPRIATSETPTHATEYAAVAELNDPGNQQIDLFHNFGGPGTLSTINLNSSLANLGCANDFPAVAFTESNFIAVSWSYEDCAGFIAGNQEVIAVSYDLNITQRIPADPNYYMLVSQNTGGHHFAPSVASSQEIFVGGTVHAPVLYSFASQGPNEMRYKLSSVINQPQVRKKAIVNVNNQISIYPNPAKNFVNIDFSSLQAETAISLRILSIEGKTVYEKNGLPNTFNQGIDLNNFDSGIYLIEYRYNDIVKQEKLIVQQ